MDTYDCSYRCSHCDTTTFGLKAQLGPKFTELICPTCWAAGHRRRAETKSYGAPRGYRVTPAQPKPEPKPELILPDEAIQNGPIFPETMGQFFRRRRLLSFIRSMNQFARR